MPRQNQSQNKMALSSDQSLNIVINAEDNASKTLGTLQNKLEDFQPAFKNMAKYGAAAFGTITGAVGLSIKAFAESQKQMSVANGIIDNFSKKTLKQFKGGTEQAKQIVKEFGDELQKLGGISGEEVSIGFAKLLQVTEDSSTAMDAATAAADFATFKNIDYGTAVDVVAKALNGQTAMLEKYGITIKEGATATEVMAALQEKVGGLYEKSGQTLAGQTKILQETFGDLQESIGSAFLPILNQLISKLQPLIERFATWAENNPDLVIKITAVAAAVTGLVAGIGTLGLILPAIISGFTMLSGPIGIVAAIIGGLVLIVYNLNESFKILQNDSALVWLGIKEMMKEAVNGMIGIAEGWANGWVMAANTIIEALNKIKISIPDWVPKIGGKSWSVNLPTAKQVTLPRFEHGGIIPGAVGTEVPIIAHGQERILPASSNGKMSSGTNISIVINNPTVRSQDDLNRMREMINDAMRDLTRGHKLSTV